MDGTHRPFDFSRQTGLHGKKTQLCWLRTKQDLPLRIHFQLGTIDLYKR